MKQAICSMILACFQPFFIKCTSEHTNRFSGSLDIFLLRWKCWPVVQLITAQIRKKYRAVGCSFLSDPDLNKGVGMT